MKRILCASMVLVMLLTACSGPEQPLETVVDGEVYSTCGVYELDFSVRRLSGWPFEKWDVVYLYMNEQIQSGYQFQFPLDLFTHYTVSVLVTERDNPENSCSASFMVPVCDGGAGKTEITVTNGNGKSTVLRVSCTVKLLKNVPGDVYLRGREGSIQDK